MRTALVFIMLVLLVNWQAASTQVSEGYTKRDVRCSLAGSSDPWGVLTKDRLRIMLALHDGLTIPNLAREFKKSEKQILEEIEQLKSVSFVRGDL